MTSRFFRKQWRLLPGGIAAIITLTLGQLGALKDLENASYQGLFQLRGKLSWDDQIVLITIDDATLGKLKQFPLPRTAYAQLLDRLNSAQAIAIGFNILFVEPNPDDDALATAIAQSGRVVLATGLDEHGDLLTPAPPLRRAALATGHINRAVESDGMVHEIDPWYANQTAFGVTLAEVYSFTETQVQLPPVDQPMWINWPGSLKDLPQYSFIDVLAGKISATAFDRKIVLVGMTATGSDALSTPYDLDPPGSGIVLHAAVLDNLLQQRYLQPVNAPWLWGMALMLMPSVSYLLIGKRLHWQILVLVIGLLSCLGGSLLLFQAAYWLSPVRPMVLLTLTTGGAIVGQRWRENLALQRLLEDLWQHYRPNADLLFGPSSASPLISDDLGDEVSKLALLANALGWAQTTQAAIAQSVPVGIVAVSDRDQVWFCNSMASRYLGLKPGDALTLSLVPEWLSAAEWQSMITSLPADQPVAPLERQRGLSWFELRFERLDSIEQPSFLLSDSHPGFLLMIEDITHRKSVEAHLRSLNEGLLGTVHQRNRQLQQTHNHLEREILQRRQIQEKLAYHALHDELTGLPSRFQFKNQLNHLLKTAADAPKQFAVLFIDCDRFKLVNDSYGHLVGDELLKAIAQRLRYSVAKTDLVARFGGDEFTILLLDIDNSQVAVKVAQRIRQQLQTPFTIGDLQLYTGGSIGIVISDAHYTKADEMLRDADTAMYRAKHDGIGFTLFEPSMHFAVRSSLQLETDLRKSLSSNELLVYYQPIFQLTTQEPIGFEALLRWQHPERGLVGPEHFIPIAEETGLILPIGHWVLKQACLQMHLWQQQNYLPPNAFMSVNLSVQQFNEPNLLKHIDQILEEAQLDGQYLKLEITESAIMANSELAVETINRLQERGIRLSIDDFGTGYSSLNYLHCFPIDVLKVDRSFIQRMMEGHKHLSLVQVIHTLADRFGMTMIAEGIETESQLQCLKDMNCRYGQGYFFCPPVDWQTVESQYLKIRT